MHMLENQGIRTEREKDKDNSTRENHTKTTRLAWHPGKVAKQQATCIMQTAGTDPKQGSVSGVGEGKNTIFNEHPLVEDYNYRRTYL